MKQSWECGGRHWCYASSVPRARCSFFFRLPGAFTSETDVHGNQDLYLMVQKHMQGSEKEPCVGLAPKHSFWEKCYLIVWPGTKKNAAEQERAEREAGWCEMLIERQEGIYVWGQALTSWRMCEQVWLLRLYCFCYGKSQILGNLKLFCEEERY